MPSFYKGISGWFNFERLYTQAAANLEFKRFVEVGVWLGKSVIYLAEELKSLNRTDVEVFAVDHFQGSVELAEMIKAHKGSTYRQFVENLERSGCASLVKVVALPSRQASRQFADASVDFVFIDGSHDFISVVDDITHWRPKVRSGGLVAGHDVGYPDVKRAVEHCCGRSYQVLGPCWILPV